MKYNILPYPQEINEREGSFDLCGVTVATENGMEYRVVRAAVELRRELAALTGAYHTYKQYFGQAQDGMIAIAIDEPLGAEAYTLEVTTKGIIIKGGDGAGCFYAIQTLKQLIAQFGGQLPCVYINDKPGMVYRGFYHDATRGRVPTLDSMKELVDTIARFKGNSLQLYVEHVFDFEEFKEQGRSEDQFLTAEELLELDEYCYDRFIDFIPSLATFGHLFELLELERFKHLCELPDHDASGLRWWHRMAHHTIDPSNPESIDVICSLIDQYLPLFRSRYFNICCDETFDLGKGRNAGKDSGELYVKFVGKITEHVRASGKITMMWADILLDHPDKIDSVHRDTVLLNWAYNPAVEDHDTVTIGKTGYTQIVCPGTGSWNRFAEDINQGGPNITRMARYGYENGAMGILNTNWGDYGHIAPWKSCLYGTVLGLCVGWNKAHTELDEIFEEVISRVVYGQDHNIVPIIRAFGCVSMSASWRHFTHYSAGGNREDLRAHEPTLTESIGTLAGLEEQLLALPEHNGIIAALLLSVRSAAFTCRLILALANGDVQALPVKEFTKWSEEYSAEWLSSSKRSELDRIFDTLKTMMNI